MQNSLRYDQGGVKHYKLQQGKLKYVSGEELMNEKLKLREMQAAETFVNVMPALGNQMEKPMLPQNIILLEQLKTYCIDSFNGGKFIENEANGKIQLANMIQFITKSGDRALTYEDIVRGAEEVERAMAKDKNYVILYRQDMDNLPADTADKFQTLIDMYTEKNDYLSKNKIASVKGLIAGNMVLKQLMHGLA